MATIGAADGRFCLTPPQRTRDRSGLVVLKPASVIKPRKKRPSTGSTAPPPQQPATAPPERGGADSRVSGARSASAAHGGEAWQLRRIVGIFGRMVGIGVLSLAALALRPEFWTPARMPPTARPAPRGGRQGPLVLTAGLVGRRYRRCCVVAVALSLPSDRSGDRVPRAPCGSHARDGPASAESATAR